MPWLERVTSGNVPAHADPFGIAGHIAVWLPIPSVLVRDPGFVIAKAMCDAPPPPPRIVDP